MAKIALIEFDENNLLNTSMRLGSLRARLGDAAHLPDDTEVKFGYLPHNLTDAFYVEETVDLMTLDFIALQPLTRSRDSVEAQAAWAEIERRINA